MKQYPLTVLVPVDRDKLGALRDDLQKVGSDVERNSLLQFRASPSTHFARYAILDHDQKRGPRLLFSSNHDGDLAAYARELADRLGAGMDALWQHCHGYPSGTAKDGAKLLEFLRRYAVPSQ